MSAPRVPSPNVPGTPLFDAAALRAVEAAALSGTDDPGALMARAGRAAWTTLRTHWTGAQRVCVVCGPGNNGGDGYVLARLALAAGCDVQVIRREAHAPRTAAAVAACAAFAEAGGAIATFRADTMLEADVIVDALYGIGLTRAVEGDDAALIRAIDAAGAPVLALDVPSGVDAGRGSVPGAAVRATRTLQFLAPHVGLQTGEAVDHAGRLDLDTLGVEVAGIAGAVPAARRITAPDLSHWLRPRTRNAHKGVAGHVLCIGGDHGMGGAVALAAEGALRSGAGLVRVATRAAHVAPVLARCPEAMAVAVGTETALAGLIAAADVVALGPGLGQDAWGHGLVFDVLAALAHGADAPALVLDADALNLVAAHPCALPRGTILTPHPGEAARLLGTTTAEVQHDRRAAVRELAARYAAVVVLKGAGTLVCAPGGVPWLVAAGNPGMATGGMGDVLTGIVAALRAQGLAPESAAACGALLHAAAGDLAARDGERGLRPTDLLQALRRCANPEIPR